jgi:hypothetical protein
MSKKSTKTKAPKATKAGGKKAKPEATSQPASEQATAAAPAAGFQIKKDAKGRFWVVAKDSGAEQGPYDTKQQATDAKTALASGTTPAAAAEKPAKAKKVKEPKAKRVSAIDAAAQVLTASKEPMNCMALVEAMATQGLWESPGGKTPSATLYSAIIREIATKGKDSRFVKKDRGMFAAASA